ncbi:MAG TPA: murein L,D-transpeptidase catalytic domain family protein [Cyclobacteriaceae bacterium]|nr:murein L,D-transpeptidase catalytic domain family protein [Cyclobacteriaceae bacterium]
MIRILTLFILFSVSPILSANINPTGIFNNGDELKPLAGNVEMLSNQILDKLKNESQLPRKEVVQFAIAGYMNLLEEGKISSGSPLSIIDFSLPSSKERLWIIDLEEGKLLHHSLVSHGRNSGDLMAKKFSNVNSSFMSSLGFYVTGETYQGKHGYSLRLDGVEKGFNDLARERAIVIHGADYANRDFVKSTGRLGRSLGCPALPMGLHKEIINTIKGGSCLFIYGNDDNYLNKSPLINI